MAVIKSDKATKLVLKVVTGSTAAGSSYASRNFQHINPELADEDAYAIGSALAALQTYPLSTVSRDDTSVLIEG